MDDAVKIYMREVLDSGVILLKWLECLAEEFMVELLDNDIIVEKIYSCVSTCPTVAMRALAYDGDDLVECVAEWKYDTSIVAGATTNHWVLGDIDVVDAAEHWR